MSNNNQASQSAGAAFSAATRSTSNSDSPKQSWSRTFSADQSDIDWMREAGLDWRDAYLAGK